MIPLRAGLETCSRLEDVRDEDRPRVAPNPALDQALSEAGLALESPASEAIRRAAGDYARSVQAIERADGINRDLQQMAHNRDLCAEHDELVSLFRRNNAGVPAGR